MQTGSLYSETEKSARVVRIRNLKSRRTLCTYVERVQSIGLLEGRCISLKIKEKLMHKYALSPQGASDMLKAFVSVTVSDLVLMIPVSLLYFIVKDYMEGTLQGKGGFYIAGIIVTLALIAITTYIQYNATFLSTYVESGVRRITLAEKLRKIPLSFFGKKICQI